MKKWSRRFFILHLGITILLTSTSCNDLLSQMGSTAPTTPPTLISPPPPPTITPSPPPIIPPVVPPTNPPTEGETTLSECSGVNSNSEPCYWRYLFNPNTCSAAQPCDKLVIIFSGGEMYCDESKAQSGAVYSQAMAMYSNDRYVTVCANTFKNNVNTSYIPYYQEADRIQLILQSIRSSSAIQTLWNGKYLLWSGISHGATAPPIAMAQTTYDDSAEWQGSAKTAACFHDGTYDPVYTDTFLQTGLFCNSLRNGAICERYTRPPAQDCPDINPNATDVKKDNLSNMNVSNFAIKDWKLIECGSAEPRCGSVGDPNGDWLPAQPINDLCSRISAKSGYRCTYETLPHDGHLSCAGSDEGVNLCLNWFDTLVGD